MSLISRHRWLLQAAIRMALLLLVAFPVPVHAASRITIHNNAAKTHFPQSISFLLGAESDVKIDQATLIYGVTSEACMSRQGRNEMEFEPARTVSLSWEWDLFRSGNLPPGVEVWWQWEIHSEDGSRLTTEVQKITIEDPNFHWNQLQRGLITLQWSSGSEEFGGVLLNLAADSLARLSKNAGLTPEGNIRLSIYPSAEDMKAALVYTTDWMGGVAFPEYKVVLIGIPPSELTWARQVIPHELAHLVTDMRTFNCLNSYPPSWLNEGLAMYAEGPVPEQERSLVKEELKNGSLSSLESIANGFPADGERANLAYAQSRQVVTFLIETYGTEKFDALLDQFRAGQSTDPALRAVYGLDTTGVEQTWRASLGFGTAPEPSSATPTAAATATTIPTLALMLPVGLVTDTPTPIPSPSAQPTSTAVTAAAEQAAPAPTPAAPTFLKNAVIVLVCLVAAGVVLALGLVFWWFLLFFRNFKKEMGNRK